MLRTRVLPPRTAIPPEGNNEICVPAAVITPPGARVWEPIMKREFGSAVIVEEPKFRMGAGIAEDCPAGAPTIFAETA